MKPDISRGSFTVDELQAALENLTIAFAVAHILTAVESLEKCLASGRRNKNAVIEALAEALDRHTEAREEWLRGFASSFRKELDYLLGHRAGEAVWQKMLEALVGGDLRRLFSALPGISRAMHEPLLQYLAARKHVTERHAAMIRAVAGQGLETITAFQFSEKLQAARTAADAAFVRLLAADPPANELKA